MKNSMKASQKNLELSSAVERYFLQQTSFGSQYAPTEKLPVIITESFPQLGKLTALRFLEWVQCVN